VSTDKHLNIKTHAANTSKRERPFHALARVAANHVRITARTVKSKYIAPSRGVRGVSPGRKRTTAKQGQAGTAPQGQCHSAIAEDLPEIAHTMLCTTRREAQEPRLAGLYWEWSKKNRKPVIGKTLQLRACITHVRSFEQLFAAKEVRAQPATLRAEQIVKRTRGTWLGKGNTPSGAIELVDLQAAQ
jgi:hypothetical protein